MKDAMMDRTSSRWARAAVVVLGLLIPHVTAAYTPESKEVKAVVARGLAFLEKSAPDDKIGGRVLVGLSFFKAGNEKHPTVKAALDQIVSPTTDWNGVDNYSLGLAIIFLGELNDQSHQSTLQSLVDKLIARQKTHGGWGYSGNGGATMPTGDISQTQYAVLGLWMAKQAGANIPQESVEKVCEYLLRVQDPSGGWGYQGVDPGTYQRVSQGSVTHSLTAAGLGSMCVCADLLGIHKQGSIEEEDPSGLPAALKVVKKPKSQQQPTIFTRVDRNLVEKSIEDGVRWFEQKYTINTGTSWNFYYLYGLERCQSFGELYYRKVQKNPKWYDDGVTFLSQKQSPQGHWEGDHSAPVSTAFALLFLQRSARKTIAKIHKDLGEGVLTSGKGLPTDLANATVKRGKIVDSPLAGEVDDVVALLEDPENPELARLLESDEPLKLDPNLTKRTDQITKLREAVSSGSWEARMVAVRAIGKTRDLDSVPSLLYALTDPDVRVVQEADAALRFMSRKFAGVGLPENPDKRAIAEAREAWRKWYLSIRPDAQLLD
jgi:hypothetical protein